MSQRYSLDQTNEGVSSRVLALKSRQKPRLGRKTLLSKAQVEDALDVKQGKQDTLKRALKVLALEGGT